jgi:hypothetical protein
VCVNSRQGVFTPLDTQFYIWYTQGSVFNFLLICKIKVEIYAIILAILSFLQLKYILTFSRMSLILKSLWYFVQPLKF